MGVQDPAGPVQFSVDALLARLSTDTATPRPLNTFALLDLAALDGGLDEFKQRLGNVTWESLFQDTRQTGAISAGPALIELPLMPDLPHTRLKLFKTLAKADADLPCVLWLRSSLALTPLRKQLTRRIAARFPDNLDMLLRFYDPRILPILNEVLSPELRTVYFAPAQEWYWRDPHTDELRSLLSTEDVNAELPIPIEITVAQQNALLDPTIPDRLVAAFAALYADEYASTPHAEWKRLAVYSYEQAQAIGGLDEADANLLCTYSMLGGLGWIEQPMVQAALRQGVANGQPVSKTVAVLPEEAWNWQATANS